GQTWFVQDRPSDPSEIVLRVLDNGGNPVANAHVRLYEQQSNQRIDNTVRIDSMTDGAGEVSFGAHPWSLYPYSGWDFNKMVDFVRINRDGVEARTFFDLTTAQVAFFRGHTGRAVLVVHCAFPAVTTTGGTDLLIAACDDVDI